MAYNQTQDRFAASKFMKKTVLIIWALLRLPLLAAGLYLFRFQIAAFIEDNYGLGVAMDFAVYSASTFGTRLIIYSTCVIALAFGYWLIKKRLPNEFPGYVLLLAGSFIVAYFSFAFLLLTSDALKKSFVVVLILAANTLPHEWLARRIPSGGLMNLVFLAGVGLIEALFPQSYVIWLAKKIRADMPIKKWSWLAGVLIAPLFWVFILTPFDNQRVITLGEKIHANPSVQKFAQGDYNWIELNSENGLLYAVGRGTNYLLAFDVNNLEQPPRRSKTDIGKVQSFAFNPNRQELYVYKADTRELLYIDALTLETFRSVPVPGLSPGDIWINWNRQTDSITIASEADVEVGTPFVMIDRASGEALASLPLPLIPTNITFHTSKPYLYFNSFRDTYLIAWDMNSHEAIQRVEISPRTDRLIFSPNTNEVLIASPLEGDILRYDAEKLEFKGKINASIGDRTLTIDEKRNLLLVGNFINNKLKVINLTTHKPVASFYIGPWIRTIALDEERGIAYVSSVRNLFKVEYAQE
jgi:DNA-binding beta-propeller fold protein YncE